MTAHRVDTDCEDDILTPYIDAIRSNPPEKIAEAEGISIESIFKPEKSA